jgi:hypothetical protein
MSRPAVAGFAGVDSGKDIGSLSACVPALRLLAPEPVSLSVDSGKDIVSLSAEKAALRLLAPEPVSLFSSQ